MKTRSQRFKFIAVLSLAVVLVVLITLALNNWGLKSYYEKQKIRSMQEAYEKIDKIVTSDDPQYYSKLQEILGEYSEKDNLSVAVYDSYTTMIMVSSERDNEYLLQKLRNKLFSETENTESRVLKETGNYTITREAADIDFFGYCSDNRVMVLMSTPIGGMQNTAEQANRFLIIVGVAALLVGIIAVTFLAGRVSRAYTLELENEKLQHDLEEKERQNKIQREFVANVSHELKTPITVIKGYAEGLAEGMCRDDESRSYYAGVIVDETERMHQIVNQLLMLSKIESGQDELEKNDFNICEMIRDIAAEMKLLAEKKKVTLNVICPDELIVNADEFKIESVITNYLSNASHHVNESGRIEIKAEAADEEVRVSVFNTGTPIPEEEQEHIWEKFYKVDKAHSRTYGGSGIGLSIVKAVMEAHDMPYGVLNHTDGVEFWIKLERQIL